MSDDFELETLALHTGIHRSQFNEHSEALYLTSSFVFDSAAQAAARFSGAESGNIYSRFTNPTVTAFEERLAALEGAETCVATSSGMSAILACVMGLLSAGDHVIASRSLFGATVSLFNNILKRFNIETTFVSATDIAAWEAAVKPTTKLLFIETPSKPFTEVSDIAALAAVAKKAGAWLAVDNCFCSPALQRPLDLGADLVDSLRHQVSGRSGQGIGRCSAWEARPVDGTRRVRFLAHRRTEFEPIQCLGNFEGNGNA